MSFTKGIIEAGEAKRSAAIGIAVAARVLRRCPYHDDVVLVNPDADPKNAYRVGNAKLTAGEFRGVFDSPRDMTDAVKALIDEHALDECPRCDTLRER